ncbi:MAG: hypothetical protein B6U89_07710 [Desulfurococcales archaeon ex4484_58]|nr:MAG: hypothetical protein B6U89_07710 [Desulfurococcales archaeon ex4484_58]
MKAIIIAGGTGSRICKILGCKGKQLIRIHGLELFMYPIISLWSIGINEFIVVVNPMIYNEIDTILEKYSQELGFKYILDFNPYIETLNGNTTLIGLKHVSEPVLLSVSDHIYPPEMPEKLLNEGIKLKSDIVVLGDKNPIIVDVREATKIKVSGDRVIEVSKQLINPDYIDTGLFLFKNPLKITSLFDVEKPVRLMDIVSDHRLLVKVVVIDKLVWKDIDVLEDLLMISKEPLRNVVMKLLDIIKHQS